MLRVSRAERGDTVGDFRRKWRSRFVDFCDDGNNSTLDRAPPITAQRRVETRSRRTLLAASSPSFLKNSLFLRECSQTGVRVAERAMHTAGQARQRQLPSTPTTRRVQSVASLHDIARTTPTSGLLLAALAATAARTWIRSSASPETGGGEGWLVASYWAWRLSSDVRRRWKGKKGRRKEALAGPTFSLVGRADQTSHCYAHHGSTRQH